MAKQQYRSEIGILSDILSIIADSGRSGVMISNISRAANVSHGSVNEKCQKLIDADLVVRDGKGRTFFITDKGAVFLEQLHRFTEIMKSMNIRY